MKSISTYSTQALISVAYQSSMNSVKCSTEAGHRSDQRLMLMETGSVLSLYVDML